MDRPPEPSETNDLIHRFREFWHPAVTVEEIAAFVGTATTGEKMEVLCIDQQNRCRHGLPIPLAEYAKHLRDVAADPDLQRRLVDHAAALRVAFGAETRDFGSSPIDLPPKANAEPAAMLATQTRVGAGPGDDAVGLVTLDEPSWPAALGRYRIDSLLGEGAFGRVYLARDAELDRLVALKVPHRQMIRTEADTTKYLTEARTLAMLDHPAIVPVHDVGRTDDGLCYVVSKYVEGQSLQHFLRENRPDFDESATMVARLAEALHHAHQRGLVHRDVKPANILLDRDRN